MLCCAIPISLRLVANQGKQTHSSNINTTLYMPRITPSSIRVITWPASLNWNAWELRMKSVNNKDLTAQSLAPDRVSGANPDRHGLSIKFLTRTLWTAHRNDKYRSAYVPTKTDLPDSLRSTLTPLYRVPKEKNTSLYFVVLFGTFATYLVIYLPKEQCAPSRNSASFIRSVIRAFFDYVQ